MKKILLGSTALAATLVSGAAFAEEPIKLSLSGYFRGYGIYQSTDLPNLQQTYFSQQGRIAMSGETTLDNGLTVGVYTQYRAGESGNQNSAGGTVRRAYAYFEGSFGRLELGSNDGAALQMGYASPDPAPAAGVNSPNFYPNAPVNFAGAAFGDTSTPTTYQNWDGANTKLSYFTPRMAGFQFGVSYSPDNCQTGPSAGSKCPSLGNAPADNVAGDQNQIWQFGANYTNTFQDIDVAVSGTYMTAHIENDLFTTDESGNPSAVQNKDRTSYSFGANLGYMGFTLGGAYLHDNKGVAGSSVDAYDVGLKYTTGPWSVGVQYIYSERDNPDSFYTSVTQDNVEAFMIGGGYALGPGIDVGAGWQTWNWDTKTNGGYAGPERTNDADMFLVGTVIKF
jgi:predicted porin